MLKIIVAMDQHRGIGFENRMPWSIKEELKQFRKITLGHGVLMGRKTLESMQHALPGRTNYVMTHQAQLTFENVIVVPDIEAFLKEKQDSDDVVFVIGGASLYHLALDYVSEMIISEVKGVYACDTFFPSFDPERFILKQSIEFEHFTQKWYERKTR